MVPQSGKLDGDSYHLKISTASGSHHRQMVD
jgi:hypothetical protein